MKHKVSTLEGASLDAAVALAEGYAIFEANDGIGPQYIADDGTLTTYVDAFRPSSCWVDGGPIIARLKPELFPMVDGNIACLIRNGVPRVVRQHGPTYLIAFARAHVASKFGEEVELP